MSSCVAALLLLPVVFLLLTTETEAQRLPKFTTIAPENREICSRNMACGWAVCMWTQFPYNPDSDKCKFISNASCRCLKNYACSIVHSSVEPTSYRQPFVQYEYQCSPRQDMPANEEKRGLRMELDDEEVEK